MFAEAQDASAAVARQASNLASSLSALAEQLRTLAPGIIFTCARGSSDHAASYAKFLFETCLGIPTVSQAPSISSIYKATLAHVARAPFLVISQSGRSPDLLLSAEAARDAGALVIALVNDVQSPLAHIAHVVIPIDAGPEKSVAATKSYICTLSAIARLVAEWANDRTMKQAVDMLPDRLAQAWNLDWSGAIAPLSRPDGLFVLGRGPTLAIAQEAALKFKETCGLHAEAFSIAEVAHGPMALVGPDFPVLIFPPSDSGAAGLDGLMATLARQQAPLLIAGQGHGAAASLPVIPDMHPNVAPIALIQSCYRMVNALSLSRGLDPDRPPLLNKVTQTR
ncbi:SIS domain-containing protein [Sphingobium algorifonticola]|uniref:SIS domain-containing protein n=2 Tax=Sphingobium algorifonticola TaxID=2008318 RepID=A0A437JAD1_9SPHN|nr:SIS domain-containing protein [Sphingobium algorifonticola]